MDSTTKGPLLIFLHRFVVLDKRRRKLMRSVVPGDKIQGARIRGIECRANRLNAWVGNRSGRQPLYPIGIVGAGARQVFLVQISVECRQTINDGWIAL